MDLQLEGRVAVVTGASKGIGLAVTRTLLAEGCRVVASSRTLPPDLKALRGEFVHVEADFMEPDAPGEVVRRATEEFEGLDILVNNVGGPPPGVTLPQFTFLEADTRSGRRSSDSTSSPRCAPAGLDRKSVV